MEMDKTGKEVEGVFVACQIRQEILGFHVIKCGKDWLNMRLMAELANGEELILVKK